MDRKDTILNNDLNAMLTHEQRVIYDIEPEFGNENQESKDEIEKIIAKPTELIHANEIIKKNIRHVSNKEYYLKLITNSSDEEQCEELHSIEHTAAYILLPEPIAVAGYELMKKRDYPKWIEILIALRYVPLQKAFCYDLKCHEDYLWVLNNINKSQLKYPHTFFKMLLSHWFEWLCKVGENIWSYEYLSPTYYDKNKVKSLKKEARKIRKEWEKLLEDRVSEILDCFESFLSQEEMIVWFTNEPLQYNTKNNYYAKEHDHCLKLIWNKLVGKGALQNISYENMDLNMLVLLAEETFKSNNTVNAPKVAQYLEQRLLEKNFTEMDFISTVDVDRQTIISKMLYLFCNTQVNIDNLICNISTRFQGWNLDYQQVYNEARREAYLFCCLLRRFEYDNMHKEERLSSWKSLLVLYLREYRRCDNEYILRSDYMLPLKLAIEIAENHLDDECQIFLHNILVENVLSIVSLLTIFTTCEIHLTSEIIDALLHRIDNEWDSARMLMEPRGQRTLMIRIDMLIDQLRKKRM